jgi:predicted dehydrogenase
VSAGAAELAGVGIVGCGFVAREHHRAAIAAAGGTIVAVADPDRAAAEGLAAAAGGARVYASHQSLLGDDRVGIVAVCTPPALHREVAVAAMESGRDVLIEKPLALTVADCDEIIAARDRSARTAAVGFNLRHHPIVAAGRAAIAAGEIGGLKLLSHSWIGPSHAGGTWSVEPASGGSLAMERGSHCLDLARFLAGTELELIAAGGAAGPGPLALSLAGEDVLASVVMAEAPASASEVRCVGERGSLELDLYAFDGLVRRAAGHLSGAAGTRARAALRAPLKLPAALRAARRGGVFRDAYTEQWRALGRAAGGGEPGALATLEDGRRAVELALALAERTGAAGPPSSLGAGEARVGL